MCSSDLFFDVRDLRTDQWNDCDGMEVLPLHSPHPVECSIFAFRARDQETYRSYAHLADIVSMKVLRRLCSESPAREILPADYAETVLARYLTPVTLKKVDGGGGLIHGEPQDFANDESEKIVLAHRAAAYTDEELEVGSQAVFGAMEVLIPASRDYQIQRAYRYLLQAFPDASIEHLVALVQSPALSLNAGSLILRRGAKVADVLLIVSGTVERSRAEPGSTKTLACGTLIGIEDRKSTRLNSSH